MYWGLYQTLLVFAGASTLALLLARRSVVPLGLFSGGVWAVLALQARNSEILREVADGVFPPEDDAAQPAADMAETGDPNFDT
jgi:hypothetical protein